MQTRLYLCITGFIFISVLYLSCRHEPFTIKEDCSTTSITVTATVSNATSSTSANGSINASASGGSNFQYSLNNGMYQGSGLFSNLLPGLYSVSAKSSSGCIGVAQFTVGNSDPCSSTTISISATINNTSIAGANDGSISATASGGTGFQYKLNTGAYQPSGTFTNLVAGVYTITAKNSNNCTGSAQFAVADGSICTGKNITINTTVINSDKCSGSGSITVSASGSTGFAYQLNGGSFQTSATFSNLLAGNYTITVKDKDNCTKSAVATVNESTAGTLFLNVKSLIQVKCKDCHMNGNTSGGVNFDNECNIVIQKDRIKARSVDEKPRAMPPPPSSPLTSAEKKIITDWINAGGKYSN